MQNLTIRALLLCELVTMGALNGAPDRAGQAPLSNLKYLRDHAETRGFTLGRPTKALPTPDGWAVLFLRARARTPNLELYEFDVASGKTRLLLTPGNILKGAEEKLSAEEKALRERMRVSLGGFTDFQLSRHGKLILLSLSGKLYTVDRASRAGFYAGLVRPRDFNPRKRYPVIVHVYGGPLPPDSSGLVISSMGAWLLPQWIADQGFVVVSIDGRGTPGRGHDWERAIFKQIGSVPLADQATGLRALGRRFRKLDLDRVGIYGWSFGGYLSALAVMKQPELFKAAVAGAPPTDWLDYDTHYTERYLGLPQTDAGSYREGSLLNCAADLQRPLLLIHGTGDDNVYFRHTLKLVNALFRSGKEFDLLPLSGLTHMVPDPVVNEQLYARIVLHFKKHLGTPGN